MTHLQLLGGPLAVRRQRTGAEEKVQRQDAAAKHHSSQHLLAAATVTVRAERTQGRARWRLRAAGLWAGCRREFLYPAAGFFVLLRSVLRAHKSSSATHVI